MSSASNDGLSAPEPDRPVILAIEHDPGLGQVLGVALQARGFDVTYTSDGREAVALVAGGRPDVLVLDVSFSNGQGFGLFEHLRDDHHLAALPLVLYTARELDDHDRGRLVLGPTVYLTQTGAGPQ